MTDPNPEPWRARSSQLGGYMLCDYRAAFDRALDEGLIELEAEVVEAVTEAKKSSPYADFGTCAHFRMQDGMRCKFPSPNAEHAPEPDQVANALSLFADVAEFEAMLTAVATLGAKNMPPSPDGKPWLAESVWKTGHLKGHIDFLSQDFSVIVDLKTTARPPDHNRPKSEHIVQLIAYYLLVGESTGTYPDTGHLLYVSSKAEWALLCTVNFNTPEMQEYIAQVADYAQFLCSDRLLAHAVPRIGHHCSSGWCPYTAICKNKIVPGPGLLVGGAHAGAPVMEAFKL